MKRKIRVTKTYKGCIDLRDYDVDDAIKDGNSIEVELNKKVMLLSPGQLKDDIRAISKTFPSTKGGKSYKLYSYIWEPDEIEL
jgi:hypothetical protein